jgi:D-3-phosphoglycerate dehydrogenase
MGRLRGQTLGLVGYGRLGQAVAARAVSFGLRICVYDPFLAPSPGDVEVIGLDDLLRESDFLSIHVPLTDRTTGLIGRRELALMKPTAYLVNTSRGGIVSEAALNEALAAGRLAGAGLDVWVEEPVSPTDPLLAHDNVVGTNHSAFYSDRSIDALREGVVRTVIGVLRGTDFSNVVNTEVLAGWGTS